MSTMSTASKIAWSIVFWGGFGMFIFILDLNFEDNHDSGISSVIVLLGMLALYSFPGFFFTDTVCELFGFDSWPDISDWKRKKDIEWREFCLTADEREHISALASKSTELFNQCYPVEWCPGTEISFRRIDLDLTEEKELMLREMRAIDNEIEEIKFKASNKVDPNKTTWLHYL